MNPYQLLIRHGLFFFLLVVTAGIAWGDSAPIVAVDTPIMGPELPQLKKVEKDSEKQDNSLKTALAWADEVIAGFAKAVTASNQASNPDSTAVNAISSRASNSPSPVKEHGPWHIVSHPGNESLAELSIQESRDDDIYTFSVKVAFHFDLEVVDLSLGLPSCFYPLTHTLNQWHRVKAGSEQTWNSRWRKIANCSGRAALLNQFSRAHDGSNSSIFFPVE